MELREIAAFLQVAQLKSFSKAARALGYSQAAVTIQIKQLEQELGIHLFDRIGKQTILTHQGMVFYDHAAAVMREISCARAAVTESQELTGALTIGTIESICASIFPDLMEAFHKAHPKVKVSMVLDSPDVLLDRMNYDHRWVKVLEEPEDIVFVASSAHPLAGQKALELKELLPEPFLLTEKDASYRFVLDRYLTSMDLRIEPFLEIGNTEFIIRLLKNNAGISFLPEFSIKNEISAGHLAVLPVKDFHMHIWRQILYHKDKWVTREMDAFIRLAQEAP